MTSYTLRFKPLVIDATVERQNLCNRKRGMIAKAERIANNETLNLKVRLRAVKTAGKLGKTLAGLVKDTELDEIQADLEMLKAKAERSRTE